MEPLPVQSIINGLADRLGLPIVLEDADQQLIAYSPHYGITDHIREQTILRRSTSQADADVFRRHDPAAHTDPFVVPADPLAGVLARLCIPVRYLDTILGCAWVLLPGGSADSAALALARETQEQLSLAMLSESRVRARESESVLSLISSDTDTRIQGLTDIEARGGFEPPRRLVVAVCSGPSWADMGIRGTFWTAAWASDPLHQLRGVTSREGVAIISVRGEPDQEVGGLLDRALVHVGQQSRTVRLVVGVGAPVETPDQAHESYRQARLAARVALSATGVGPVAWWQRLGIYRFLSQLPTQTLHTAVDPRVAVLASDHPVLAETLECYLAHSGAVGVVADALHIHRTTLYYRLERVATVGLDPSKGSDRTTAAASLAALRLLGRWPPQ